jgi:hypothetical protein
MKLVEGFVFFVILAGMCKFGDCSFDGELKKVLFDDYDPYALSKDDRTEVRVRFVLTGVIEVDTIKSYVILSGSLKHWWHDARLMWDPADYGHVEKIRVSTDPEADYFVWKPDVCIYERNSQEYEYTLAQVTYDGNVYWSSIGTFQISVNFQMNSFPFDTQEIRMTLESWSYTADIIYLFPHEDTPFDLRKRTFIENVEWTIVDYTTQSSLEEYKSGNYSTVVYLLYIKRQGQTIERTIIFPAIVVSFLSFLYYFLPIGTAERTNFLSTLLLTIIMFLVMLTAFVPHSKNTSGIVDILFILTIMIFIVIMIVLVLDWFFNRIPEEEEDKQSKTILPINQLDVTQLTECSLKENTGRKLTFENIVPISAPNNVKLKKRFITRKKLRCLDKIVASFAVLSFCIFLLASLVSLYSN